MTVSDLTSDQVVGHSATYSNPRVELVLVIKRIRRSDSWKLFYYEGLNRKEAFIKFPLSLSVQVEDDAFIITDPIRGRLIIEKK